MRKWRDTVCWARYSEYMNTFQRQYSYSKFKTLGSTTVYVSFIKPDSL